MNNELAVYMSNCIDSRQVLYLLRLRWEILLLSDILYFSHTRYLRQVQLSRAGLASSSVPAPLAVPNEGIRTDAAPLVRALMLTLGETLSVWTKPAAMATLGAGFGKDDQDCNGVKQKFGFCPSDTLLRESRPTGEEALALAGAHVGLLRALFTEERWSAALADHIREVSSRFSPITHPRRRAVQLWYPSVGAKDRCQRYRTPCYLHKSSVLHH